MDDLIGVGEGEASEYDPTASVCAWPRGEGTIPLANVD